MEVRSVTESEREDLRHLAMAIYSVTFADQNTEENMRDYLATAFSPEQMLKEWTEPGSSFQAAFDNGRMIGYLRLRLSEEANQQLGPSNIELQRLYLLPEYQGKGVANTLMQACIDEARQRGFTWLWLGVWEQNFKAQRFYTKWGFEKFGEHVFWMGDDPQTDWLMKKQLN